MSKVALEQCVLTLFHFLWEASAIAAVLFVLLVLLQKRTAKVHYRLSYGALIVLILAPIASFCFLYGRLDDAPAVQIPGGARGDFLRAGGSSVLQDPFALSTKLSPARRAIQMTAGLLDRSSAWLLVAWLSAALLLMTRQFLAWIMLRRVLMRHTCPLRKEWDFSRLLLRMGITQRVEFLESRVVDVPATVGWLHPVVLLPPMALMKLDRVSLEAVTAHELSHIRRKDFIANVLQTTAESLLFWHPAVWWVSKKVREEREHCCDDEARDLFGVAVFGKALTAIEELRPDIPMFALGVSGDGELIHRVHRMMGIKLPSRRFAPGALSGLIGATAICLFGFNLLLNTEILRASRGVGDVQTLSAHTYEILGVKQTGPDFLPWYRKAVKSPDDAEALKMLAQTIAGGGDPQSVAKAIMADARVSGIPGTLPMTQMRVGNYIDRVRVAERMWSRAIVESDAQLARIFARAALLLNAQEGGSGAAMMSKRLRAEKFANVSGLSQEQVLALNRHVDDHLAVGRAAFTHQERAESLLDVVARDIPDSAEALRQTMIEIAFIDHMSNGRIDLQWEVIRLAGKTVAASAAEQRDSVRQQILSAIHAEGDYRRLLDQSMSYSGGRRTYPHSVQGVPSNSIHPVPLLPHPAAAAVN